MQRKLDIALRGKYMQRQAFAGQVWKSAWFEFARLIPAPPFVQPDKHALLILWLAGSPPLASACSVSGASDSGPCPVIASGRGDASCDSGERAGAALRGRCR
eukprot:2005569-Pleurochrysis_carterae.AAC.3